MKVYWFLYSTLYYCSCSQYQVDFIINLDGRSIKATSQLQDHHCGEKLSWEKYSPAAVCWWLVRPAKHHGGCGLSIQESNCGWQDIQPWALGHCGPIAIQDHCLQLLQAFQSRMRSLRSHSCLFARRSWQLDGTALCSVRKRYSQDSAGQQKWSP